MCLILFANNIHPDYRLVLAANRDERYARRTAAAAFWDGEPRIYGGRDLEQGGTWLGITRDGAFAAVTNYRSSNDVRHSSRSRGELVANYLRAAEPPANYVEHVRQDAGAYHGFNLLVGNGAEVHWFSNRSERTQNVAPGVHGLSNHLLNTRWPKVEQGKKRLGELLKTRSQALIDSLFAMLAERTLAPDDTLPETGVGITRERVLSPAFIVSPGYGTRSSTVLLIDNYGEVTFLERNFGEGGSHVGATAVSFPLETAPKSAAA
jgi:uncharacterized protein with NRDE domain